MKWYNFFSNFYDTALEKLYRESRVRAIDYLDLKDGHVVIDIACGTGANFSHILNTKVDVTLCGTDFSEGMLLKAQKLIEKEKWTNTILFQADARDLTPAFIENRLNEKVIFDQVLCVLGLSVIPDWEEALEKMLGLLNPGGRIVIVDVYAEKRDFNTWLVEKFARADLDRKIWQTLKLKTNHFKMEYLPVKESKVGGKLFVATGLRN